MSPAQQSLRQVLRRELGEPELSQEGFHVGHTSEDPPEGQGVEVSPGTPIDTADPVQAGPACVAFFFNEIPLKVL